VLYDVLIMYLDSSTVQRKGTSYTRHLLRESYREGGKVKHRTIANLSGCSAAEIEAIRLALRHKHELASLTSAHIAVELEQGGSCGAVLTLYAVAKQLGLAKALGGTQQGRLALWQVIARAIDQGSRLSAVRLAGVHAAAEVLGLAGFDEDDLYANLDWLAVRQRRIEDRLFADLGEPRSGLYLYDVTSSYLEGEHNELAAFGYNRDGKRGKRQIVIGLLCTGGGVPISIEVFRGTTQDPQTVAAQVRKVAERFGGLRLTLVGDRGMLRGPQIAALPEGFGYITAITKPQIETLVAGGLLQMSLFDEEVSEVLAPGGVRYVVRRNPVRAAELAWSRADKLKVLRRMAEEATAYLASHRRARVEVQQRALEAKAVRLKIQAWATVVVKGRELSCVTDEAALAEVAKLDGCYAITTNLSPAAASAQTVHDRYRDLALVEQGFRTTKTVGLEMRPIHVRLASRTRGHVLVVMLAYRLVQELARRWAHLNLTVQEGLDQLATLASQKVTVQGTPAYQTIPRPSPAIRELLAAAGVTLPAALPPRRVTVATKKKLQSRRRSH